MTWRPPSDLRRFQGGGGIGIGGGKFRIGFGGAGGIVSIGGGIGIAGGAGGIGDAVQRKAQARHAEQAKRADELGVQGGPYVAAAKTAWAAEAE